MPRGGIKICLIVIIFFSLIFSPLYLAKAESGWLLILKEFTLDVLARILARTLTSAMSNGIVSTILTSGRALSQGSPPGPAFVQDWRDFLETAQYRGEDTFRAQLGDAISPAGSATICPYLRQGLGDIFNAQRIRGFDPSRYRIANLQYFNNRNRCSLPSNFNVDSFRNDFTQGGWAAWEQLIQPQNNFYGTYADSVDELENQRNFEEDIDAGEGESGSGYISRRTGCNANGANGQCLIMGEIVTPADLFGKSGAATIDRELDWLVSSDELQEVIVSVLGALTQRLTNFAATSIIPSARNVTGDIDRVPPNATEIAQNGCVKAKEPDCTLKAKIIQCDVAAGGGSGGSGGSTGTGTTPGSGGSGGEGGSASVNCEEVIDQGVFSACMEQARLDCGFAPTP